MMKHRLRAFMLGSAVVLIAAAAHAQPATEPVPPPQGAPAHDAAVDTDAGRKSDSGFVDTAREWAKSTQILERLEGDIDGWYPRLGGMTRGSGFALGPGYRMHVFGDQVRLDVSAALSTRLYRTVDVRARWLQAWQERVDLWTEYRYENYPQEDFFGIGPDTTEDMRTSYQLHGSDIAVRGHVKPFTWLRLGGTLGYITPTVGAGRDREFPSIDEIFTDVSTPGLIEQPNFLHSEVSAEVDYRDAPGNPTGGGFYRAAYSTWDDRTLDAYNFRRFETLAIQYVPITADRKHVASGRVGSAFVNNPPGDRVPFYALPYVGGQDTVRGLREFRFKDENAFWFGAEYRWIPIKWASGVIFADFGQVAHDWQDLTRDLKHGFGFGVRGHTRKQTFAKLDFGFGSGEGWRTFLSVGIPTS
jgi:hypothetical protein